MCPPRGQAEPTAAGEIPALGTGRKRVLQTALHLKQGTGSSRQPALVLLSWASRRVCAQKPRPTVIPLEAEVRQLVLAQLNCSQVHWSQSEFGSGESTARLYPLLGNNSHAENHKPPWQGAREKEVLRPSGHITFRAS